MRQSVSQKSLARIKKNIFVQGSYESLERLEGKTGEGPFFMVRSDRITVCYKMTFPMTTSLKVTATRRKKITVLYDNKIQANEAACSYTEHKNYGKITCSRFQDVRQFQMTITYGNCSNFSNLNMYQNLFFNVFKGHRGPTPNQDLGYLIIPYDGTIALGRIFFLIQTNAQYERSKLVLLFQ